MGVTLKNKASGLTKSLTTSNKLFPEGFAGAYLFEASPSGVTAVSIPMVDRIAVSAELPAELLGETTSDTSPAERYKKSLKEAIDNHVGGLRKPNKGKPFAKGFPKKDELRAWIKVGPRGTRAEIHLKPIHDDEGTLVSYKIRLEWNPRKAGTAGFEQLRDCLAEHFQLAGLVDDWLRSTELTRLHIAVDVLGAERHDVFAHLPDALKIQTYARVLTGIETANHHTSKSIYRRSALTVYDKRQERLDADKKPKFGALPHVRLERRYEFKKTKPTLGKLRLEPNRLDFRVRWLRELHSGPSKEEQNVAAALRSYLGAKATSAICGGAYAKAAAFIIKPDVQFWQSDEIWSGWPASVRSCGLEV